jgi:aminodeoxyfutalosine deaminase
VGITAIIAGMSGAAFAKSELHLHLEGSMEAGTLKELDPAVTDAEIALMLDYRDFEGFMRAFVWENRKLRGPADYALVARRLFEKLAREGIGYAEVTLSAGAVLWKKQDLGVVFDAVAAEGARARGMGLEVRWILDAVRQWGADAAAPVFDFAASHIGSKPDGVVAIGLGGFEEQGPALWFRDLYARARDRGLRLTCHAGETTSAQSVWDALEIGAERIGHGIRAVEDPRLLDHLRERNIPLEVCVTSNVRTGAVSSLREHPLRRLFDAGVPVVLNTDDPALFGCSLAGEFELARRDFGFSETELAAVAGNSLRYAFGRHAAST